MSKWRWCQKAYGIFKRGCQSSWCFRNSCWSRMGDGRQQFCISSFGSQVWLDAHIWNMLSGRLPKWNMKRDITWGALLVRRFETLCKTDFRHAKKLETSWPRSAPDLPALVAAGPSSARSSQFTMPPISRKYDLVYFKNTTVVGFVWFFFPYFFYLDLKRSCVESGACINRLVFHLDLYTDWKKLGLFIDVLKLNGFNGVSRFGSSYKLNASRGRICLGCFGEFFRTRFPGAICKHETVQWNQ